MSLDRGAGPDRSLGARPELALLFEQAVAFYLQLRKTAALIHGRGDLSGPRRTVLLALARSGPQTVAHLARTRGEPRQRFQPLVNALIQEGLLRQRPNPVHNRSNLIELTSKGHRAVRHIVTKEARLRSRLKLQIPPRELAAAADVLRQLREMLADPATVRMLGRSRRPTGT